MAEATLAGRPDRRSSAMLREMTAFERPFANGMAYLFRLGAFFFIMGICPPITLPSGIMCLPPGIIFLCSLLLCFTSLLLSYPQQGAPQAIERCPLCRRKLLTAEEGESYPALKNRSR